MRKEVEITPPVILEQEENIPIPNGWFTVYHIKSNYSVNGLYKRLKRMELDGILESKIGKVKTKNYMKNMIIFRKK